MRPVREITAEMEHRRTVELIPGEPRFLTSKCDPVEPEPVGTIIVTAFRVTGYDPDCDGSLMARLEHIDKDGSATGWEQDSIPIYPDGDLVVTAEEWRSMFDPRTTSGVARLIEAARKVAGDSTPFPGPGTLTAVATTDINALRAALAEVKNQPKGKQTRPVCPLGVDVEHFCDAETCLDRVSAIGLADSDTDDLHKLKEVIRSLAVAARKVLDTQRRVDDHAKKRISMDVWEEMVSEMQSARGELEAALKESP